MTRKQILNNYVHGLGNYEISQKTSSDNIFSRTGGENGGIAQIHSIPP